MNREFGYDDEFGYEDEFAFEDESWSESSNEYEEEFEFGNSEELDPETEMELAAELLSLESEEELDQFIGKVFKVGRSLLRGPIAKALGGSLKGLARKALPVAGTFLGGPIGGIAAKAAGSLLGLEAEGMSEEDMEFESAKRFVQIANTAAKKVAQTPGGIPPRQAAEQAVKSAIAQHAPTRRAGQGGGRNSGRWVRRGRTVVIIGL